MTAPERPIELWEFPEPDLPEGGALLATAFSEVCGTAGPLGHGRLAGVPYPIIPGHVSAGLLAKLRGTLTGIGGHRLVEGDRVVFFDVHRTCGRCRARTARGATGRRRAGAPLGRRAGLRDRRAVRAHRARAVDGRRRGVRRDHDDAR